MAVLNDELAGALGAETTGGTPEAYQPSEADLQALMLAAGDNKPLANWLEQQFRRWTPEYKREMQAKKKDEWLQERARKEGLVKELRARGQLKPLPEVPEP